MVEIKGQNLNATLQSPQIADALNPDELEKPSLDFVEQFSNNKNELHQKQEIPAEEKINLAKKESSNSIQEFFKNGPPWFQNFRNYFVISLNAVGIGLNSLSAIASNSNIMPKPVAEYLDKVTEWYSRYVIPLGYTWNGFESLVGERPIEAIARFTPALGFIALPFYNFNLVTGLSSGISYVLGKAIARNGDKQPGVGSALENTKGVLKHTKDIFKEFFDPKSKENIRDKIGIFGMFAGSIGGLLTAAHQRDSFVARIFGTLRNIGGLSGDYELVFNDHKNWRAKHERVVGSTCSLASILNIIARFVNPKLGRTFNQLSLAADSLGLTYWAQMSKVDNDEASGKMKQNQEEKLYRLSDTKALHAQAA